MQQATAKKRGRPRKNPLPVEVPKQEQKPVEVVAEPEKAPSGNDLVATGIRPCPNSRWIMANLNGELIQVKILKSRKSPKHQPYKVRHIVGSQYEEIR